MNESYYIVRYTGPFGFIKPWTAVRDGETYSQQFLTPSIIEGMRIKLEVSRIARHKLSHQGFSLQQEHIQAAGWKENKKTKTMKRNTSILDRGVLLNPCLHLAFDTKEEASCAAEQHLCLCRNEDIVYPDKPFELPREDFEALDGFELIFGADQPGAFLVGYNRFADDQPMYGRLSITGHPTFVPPIEL